MEVNTEFKKLFSPIKIRGLELKNRIIMTAMGTHMAGNDKEVTEKLINYHVARAKGGVAMNTTEVCSVETESSPKRFLSISEDKYIHDFKKLTNAVHENGGKMCIQLWQGGLAVGSDTEAEIILPSDMTISAEYTIKGATIRRIERAIKAYGEAARRAVEAGFDAIEFHCAHNYMPHSFLSAGINHRTDEYGGSFKNRARFPLACIKAIRANIPKDIPLFMRIGCHDDELPDGLKIEDIIEFCKMVKKDVDVLNISRGNILTNAIMYETPPIDLENGFNVEKAARIRKETGMLTMPAGRINTPKFAEEILDLDKADLIAMSRAQIGDPEFCNKVKEGKLSSIKYCIGCDQGCYDYFVDPTKEHITCLRNPAVGYEEEYALTKTDRQKKVLIAGGGIAGLEAADILVKRGHIPIICEVSDALGGQFMLAGIGPRKSDIIMATKMAVQNVIDIGVNVRLNTFVTAEVIDDIKPDAVIVAIGAEPFIPPIPGVNEPYVTNSHDILRKIKKVEGNVVVVGGGLVGLEVAELLVEEGCGVTVIEMRDEVGADLGGMRKIAVAQALAKSGIKIHEKTKCLEIKDNKVITEQNGEIVSIDCDGVVIAVGTKSRSTEDIAKACEDRNIPYYIVGDAKRARRALDAIHEAFEVSRNL